jgi:hypothetical protein
MNRIERVVDGFDPGLSVRLRALKLRFRHHVVWQLVRDVVGPADVGVDVGAGVEGLRDSGREVLTRVVMQLCA